MEITARRERYLATRTRLVHLPLKRNQGQFDFAFQPSIEEYVVEALSNLANAAQAADIL